MRIGLLTSDQIRHKYFAEILSRRHELALVVSERRDVQRQIQGGSPEDTLLLAEHFQSLEDAQRQYFGAIADFPAKAGKVVAVEPGCINTEDVAKLIRESELDGMAVFGSGILKPFIFESCRGEAVNAHQGLSPYYRGSGTNFWPFHNGELEYVGVTVHYIDPGIDTGGIICHGRPVYERGDSMHRVGCKVVEISARLVSQVFESLGEGRTISGIPQWDKGKLYRVKDFTADAVRTARKNISQGLIEAHIDRVAAGTAPRVQVIELA